MILLHLPYLGNVPTSFEGQIWKCVQNLYGRVSHIIVYSPFRALVVGKDPFLPNNGSIIYQCKCRHCDGRYLGKTLDHFGARIQEHIPPAIVTLEVKASHPRRGRPPKKKQPAELRAAAGVSTRPPRHGRQSRTFDLTDYSTDPNHYNIIFCCETFTIEYYLSVKVC